MITAIVVIGGVAEAAAWWLVWRRRVSVWVAPGPVLAAAGLAAVATGKVSLCPAVSGAVAVSAGVGAGVALFGATRVFVWAVERAWPAFRRHAEAIYDQRGGLSVPAAVGAALVVVAGEELFWRGLVQGRLSQAVGRTGGALAAWGAYFAANAPSGSLPILAAAVVGGAVWGVLAFWTRGILAPLLCHAVWTSFMIAFPPDGSGPAGPDDAAPAGPAAPPPEARTS
ncbi:MAG: CPBP family intramembrane metalloprotease [Actinomycetota bacterium]|nr:CPBP family intramembrane metalloprotease [Actinomycetota bacterium]